MSILNVEHLSHGFGDRAIFQDVSFRLLKGEHIGLVGANGVTVAPIIGSPFVSFTVPSIFLTVPF